MHLNLPEVSSELYQWSNAILTVLISATLTGIIIPRILLISFRKRLFDPHDTRKIHKGIVPRLGGIAFKPAIFFSMLLVFGVNVLIGRQDMMQDFNRHAVELVFMFCTMLLLYFIGIADDLVGVRYRDKFAIQISCGILLVISGIWINNLHGLFGIYSLSPFIGYPLTILVVVFITNAINLIDGIDGLAAGLSGIALLFYGVVFMQREQQFVYAMLAFAALGTLIPFFYYNVFGNAERGRKIFMGDTGSLTIGILLSFLSIAACTHQPTESSRCNPFVTAFAPLIVPCFDVLRVFLHRLRNRQPLFSPDKNHIHHKLLCIGLTQRRTMVTLLAVSVFFTILNIGCSPWANSNLLLATDILLWSATNVWLTRIMKKKSIPNKKEKQSIETFPHYAN